MTYKQLIGRVLRVGFNKLPNTLQRIAFRAEFKRRFRTNLTVGQPFRLGCLRYVGRYSYGRLNVVSYGNEGEGLEIGEFVSIAPGVVFNLGGNHTYTSLSTYPFAIYVGGLRYDGSASYSKGPIIVEDDVWIGAESRILSGVRVGQGAIVGAYAVVAKSVPPYAVVVGNPARIIKYRFESEVVEKLVNSLKLRALDPAFVHENAALLSAPLTPETINELLRRIKIK
jgi:virginiamycin A acetyltransferase